MQDHVECSDENFHLIISKLFVKQLKNEIKKVNCPS